MDTRLLKHYETELAFIREMGAEFAQAYPKVAGRLGMEDVEVNDPYVERLIESFAFLTSRIQLELDMRFPVFTQHLLEIVYPHYLAPTPAMFVAKLAPDAGIAEKFTVKRGARMRAPLRSGEQTACEFRTCHEVDLWPLKIKEVQYYSGRGDVVAAGIGDDNTARAALRFRLEATAGLELKELDLDHLDIFLPGSDRTPWMLHEHLIANSIGVTGRSVDRRDDWIVAPEDAEVKQHGFEPGEAILPYPGASFDGYRLLQEYFSLPQRFFFMRLSGLKKILKRAKGNEVDVHILLSENRVELQETLTTENFALYCSPVVNLLEKRCDRVHVRRQDADHFIVVDRTVPMDFEIHTLLSVEGITTENEADLEFRPFYSSDDYTAAGETHSAYYSVRRRFRQRSERQKLKGTRTSYLGTDIFLSLVDRNDAPYPEKIEQLAVRALCTNRDLPTLVTTGKGDTDFQMIEGGPITSVRAMTPISSPKSSSAIDGSSAWRLVSHLSLNYLSMDDADRGSAAAAVRELLGIYTPRGDKNLQKQLEGISSVTSRPIVRRMTDEVLSTAVRGLEVNVTFDESYFEGTGVYLLGAVLEHFFAKYVSLNSFTETAVHTVERGEIARWAAKSGRRRMI